MESITTNRGRKDCGWKSFVGVSGQKPRVFQNYVGLPWKLEKPLEKLRALLGWVVQMMLRYKQFILLCFTLLHLRDTVFYKVKVCNNPSSSKSINIIFPTAFAHFMSQNISIVFIIIFVMIICDQ